jgi:hypothetical protein
LDGAWCDAAGEVFAVCLLAVLADLFAAARRVFEGGVLADLTDGVRAAFPEDVFGDFVLGDFALEDFLGDFLRVFLDIRLPFVAFGGSTIRELRGLSRRAGIEPAAGQV